MTAPHLRNVLVNAVSWKTLTPIDLMFLFTSQSQRAHNSWVWRKAWLVVFVSVSVPGRRPACVTVNICRQETVTAYYGKVERIFQRAPGQGCASLVRKSSSSEESKHRGQKNRGKFSKLWREMKSLGKFASRWNAGTTRWGWKVRHNLQNLKVKIRPPQREQSRRTNLKFFPTRGPFWAGWIQCCNKNAGKEARHCSKENSAKQEKKCFWRRVKGGEIKIQHGAQKVWLDASTLCSAKKCEWILTWVVRNEEGTRKGRYKFDNSETVPNVPQLKAAPRVDVKLWCAKIKRNTPQRSSSSSKESVNSSEKPEN